MAQSQITYTDKVENGGATNDGKVLAVDMNELKSVVNANATDVEGSYIPLAGNIGNPMTGSLVLDNDEIFQGSRRNELGMEGFDQLCFIDFHSSSDGSQADYSARIIRNSGVNGNLTISNLGSGISKLSGNGGTALGVNATVTGLNQIQLGDSGDTTYAYGAVQDRSDERDKADIEDIHLGLDFIDALTPRSYKFDYREDYREHTTEMQEVITQDEGGNNVITYEEVLVPDTRELGEITHDGTHKRGRLHCGLVAQEVKQVMDDLGVDFGGYQDHSINGGQDVLSIGYGELIAPMIKAIQELKERIEVLEG